MANSGLANKNVEQSEFLVRHKHNDNLESSEQGQNQKMVMKDTMRLNFLFRAAESLLL